jgi:iron(III) transport system permease protein
LSTSDASAKADRAAWRPRIDGRAIYLALTICVIGYLTIPPIATVFVASFQSAFLSADSEWTYQHYVQSFTDPSYLGLIGNSLAYGLGTTCVATTLGAALAWLLMRTDVRFKTFIFVSASLPFFIPGLLNTFANIFLLSPEIGLLNFASDQIFGIRPFAVYSMAGMIFVQSIHLTPIAFAMLVGIFQSMDVTLEESARASGANDLQVLRKITLKLAAPGIFSAALLIFVETISSFEVPTLIGVPGHVFVFVSQIYDALSGYPQDFGSAATLSTLVMAISIAGITMSQRLSGGSRSFATITGKGFKPQPMKLGACAPLALAFVAIYFVVAVLFPLAILIWVSLLPSFEQPSIAVLSHMSLVNYRKVLHMPRILEALTNSLQVTLSAAAIVMVLTAIAAYVTVKTRLRGRAILDGLIFIPIAIPGTVLGVSVLFWYLMAPLPFVLYGTLTIIVIGFVTLYLPYGMRFMTPAMIQISCEMEEAARASGATFGRTMMAIYRPLLTSSLLGGFLLIFILSFREVSAAVFLFAQGTELFSLAIYDLWGEGLFGLVSALGVMMIVVSTIFVVAAQKIFGVKLVQSSKV